MSKETKELYEIFKKEYIERGYMYSGSISPFEHQTKNYELSVYKELVNLKLIQRRSCDAFCYELTQPERKKLINEKKLNIIWQDKAPYFYPNGEYGEVTKVLETA